MSAGDNAGDHTLSAGVIAAPAKGTELLAVGQQVTDRYRIVRFIARGGMGEVYEADDRVLGDRVALKVLRPDTAASPAAIERFRREVLLARRVTHPNVCRLHDVGAESKPDGGLLFLTMELLSGETLADRLAGGAFTVETAGRLARGMAAALAAAHDAGVVHRDFKSSNVMLVPSPAGERVVVTDFGLARNALGSADEALTAERAVLGTPAYMAPEQVEGKIAGPPADIYAFGVVLYEMITGRRPFTGENPMVAATRRLFEDPPDPALVVPGLEERWRTAILRCLARAPEARFDSALAVLDALGLDARSREESKSAGSREDIAHGSTIAPAVEPAAHASTITPATGKPDPTANPPAAEEPSHTAARARSRWPFALAIPAIAVTAFVLARRGDDGDPPSAPVGSGSGSATTKVKPPRPSIAVAGFEITAPDKVWLGTALAELIALELAAEDIRVIPNDRVTKARLETPATDDAGLATLATRLEVSNLVTGTLAIDRDALQLALVVRTTGAPIRIAIAGTAADLVGLAHRAANGVLSRVLGLPARAESLGVRASLPINTSAARLYVEGLVLARTFELSAARTKLEAAITVEPEFSLSYHALANVLAELGEENAANEAARKAWERADKLPREEKLLVEVRFRKASGDTARTVEIYRALRQLFPDELAHGLALAELLAQTDGAAAAEVTAELRKQHHDHPMIDAAEGYWLMYSDLPRSVAMLRRGVASARARGEHLLLARVLVDLYRAATFAGINESAGVAEAKQILERYGDRPALAYAANIEGDQAFLEGRLHDAVAHYEESIKLATLVQLRAEIASGQCSLLVSYTELGDSARAAPHLAPCVDGTRDAKPSKADLARLWRAARELLLGDLAAAERDVEGKYKDSTGLITGHIAYWRNDPAAARKTTDAGIAMDEKSGDFGEGVEFQVLRARVELAADQPADCERHARAAIELALKAKRNNLEAAARYTLIACQLAHTKAEVTSELAAADRLATKDEHLGRRLWRAIVHARASVAMGKLDRTELDAVLATARTAHYVPYELEAERELAILTGDARGLAAVKARARTAGLLVFAR